MLRPALAASLSFAALLGAVPAAAQQDPQQDGQQDAQPGDGGTGGGARDLPASAPRRPAVATEVGHAAGGPGFGLTPDRRAVLHLGIDAGAGFDTNPYSTPTEDAEATFLGDATVRLRPSAELDYPGSTVSFRAGAMLDYGILPGVIDEDTRTFLLYQSLLSADLEVNRGGALTFAIGDALSWNSDPAYVTVGALLNRINNQLHAGVGARPGGGAIQLRLGYAFGFTKYLDIEGVGGPVAIGVFDSMQHGLELRADYKFLPKTGVFLVASGGWHSYPFSTVNPTSFPVAASLGLQGQVLPKLAGLVSVGYSNPLTVEDGSVVTGNVVGVIGQAEVRWAPTPVTTVAGGFQRIFQPAPLYQYITSNRFYGSFSQIVAARFLLGINAGYSVIQFGEEQDINNVFLTDRQAGDRLDGHLDASAQVAYFFVDWFSIAVADRINWRVTNASDITLGRGNETNLGFIRNETLLLASIRY